MIALTFEEGEDWKDVQILILEEDQVFSKTFGKDFRSCLCHVIDYHDNQRSFAGPEQI